MSNLISIIVPVYKVEPYLERCIASILTSTYSSLEILLVDDGSPDKCPMICDQLASKFSQIKAIHKKNGGVSSARNVALDVATGDYVLFVDSDDWINPDMVEILYRILKETNSDISIIRCKAETDYTANKALCDYNPENIIKMNSEQALKEMCLGKNFEGHSCGKLIKKNLFKDIRFPENITICEDMLVVTELFLKTSSIAYYPYSGYHYLQRPSSALHAPVKESDWSVITACEKMYTLITNNCPKIQHYFDYVFVSQSLILAMRLNAYGKLTSTSRKKLKRIMASHWSKSSMQFFTNGSIIRCKAFMIGKLPFTICNWVLRTTRKYRNKSSRNADHNSSIHD